jgi:uncharacterized RDD family membrane protein YckC
MNENYYILEDGEQTGPFTFDELIEKEPDIHTRILPPNDDSWKDACDLPELFEYFIARGVNFPTEDNLASFWIRLAAFIIDTIILSFIVDILLAVLATYGVLPDIHAYANFEATITAINRMPAVERVAIQFIIYLSVILYNSIGETSKMKGSFGKRICRLVVVDVDGDRISFPNALLRGLGKVVIMYFMGIGFLTIFFSERRQGLHDYLAKTYVVRRDS